MNGWYIASAIATWVIAGFAIFTFWKVKGQAKATEKQAIATQQQADTVTKEFELRTRPWLNVIEVLKPEVALMTDSVKWRIVVGVRVKNVGSIPAKQCRTEIKLEFRGRQIVSNTGVFGVIFPNHVNSSWIWKEPFETPEEAGKLKESKDSLVLKYGIYYKFSNDDPTEHFTYFEGCWNPDAEAWVPSDNMDAN